MDLHWNRNGNWLLTGSRDRLVKVFDIRMMKEIFTFRGHKKEAACEYHQHISYYLYNTITEFAQRPLGIP